MNKKRKVQLTIIVILMILLSSFLLYTLGKSIYDFVERTRKSEEIVEKFNEIYDIEGTKIILFASPTCKWCKQFVPVLDEIAEENNFKYEYLDVGSLFEDDLNNIYNKMNIKFEGIPHLVVINNKEVIGEQVGAQDKETTIELLRNVGIIEGDVEDGESISTSS